LRDSQTQPPLGHLFAPRPAAWLLLTGTWCLLRRVGYASPVQQIETRMLGVQGAKRG